MNIKPVPTGSFAQTIDSWRWEVSSAGKPQVGVFTVGLRECLLQLCLALGIILLPLSAAAQPRLNLPVPLANGRWQVAGQAPSNHVMTLQASSNLVSWTTIAVLHDKPADSTLLGADSFAFPDAVAGQARHRFYRLTASPRTSADDWKDQIYFPSDAFLRAPSYQDAGGIRWVKFFVLLNEPQRVFYQDSTKYLLHYDFATQRLDPFRGLSRLDFDARCLYLTNQQAILGSVLFPPASTLSNNLTEFGIQLMGKDPYPAATVKSIFELVRSTVVAPAGTVAYYFPAFEQSDAAASYEAELNACGIRISSGLRWIPGDQVYSKGWALGRLRYIPVAQIDSAYASGSLLPTDILLTDAVSAEIPFVAGILSLSPATPSSHVAILAEGYQIPFAYVSDSTEQARLRALADHDVVFQTSIKWGLSVVDVLDVNGVLDPALRTALLALKRPPPVDIQPKAHLGVFSVPVDALTLADIRYVGGKAANLGLLRRMLPTNSPVAVAFTFDLYDAFMDQILPSGKTLRSEIAGRLQGFSYPPDIAALRTVLSGVRDLITKTAQFSTEQRQAILSALAGYDPVTKIRFRSSSNAEDNRTFSAAGLYDSYSGCLADDTDGDSVGPSHCDPEEINERGVFRAMQKVYASFYNDNAYLERLRRGIDESQVGVGLLVHYSTPDETELANGVGTVSWVSEGMYNPPRLEVQLVSQAGAVSVTNPDTNSRPEVVVVRNGFPTQEQSSNLVPLGSKVMSWPADYQAFAGMLQLVYSNYCAPNPSPSTNSPILDFEYKKTTNGWLLVKQVRELPVPPPALDSPYLINQPTTYWVYQSEVSRALSNHRVKGFLTLETTNLLLAATNLNACFYSTARFEYREGTNLLTLAGPPASWPGAAHTVKKIDLLGTVVEDSWAIGTGTNQKLYCLRTVIPQVNPTERAFIPQREMAKWLTVTYPAPVPVLDWRGNETNTLSEQIQLVYQPDLTGAQPVNPETITLPSGLEFQVSFYNVLGELQRRSGINPDPIMIGPMPLAPVAESRITGLTSQPIVLHGYYSQSAAPGHCAEEFVFEPQLEPGLPAAQLEELKAKDIQLIYLYHGAMDGVRARALGYDGHFRPL